MAAPLFISFALIAGVLTVFNPEPGLSSSTIYEQAVLFQDHFPVLQDPTLINFKITWLYDDETLVSVPCSSREESSISQFSSNTCEKESGFFYRRLRFKNRKNRKVGFYWKYLEKEHKAECHLILTKKVFSDLSINDFEDIEKFLTAVKDNCAPADPLTKKDILLLIEKERTRILLKEIAEEQARKERRDYWRAQEQERLLRKQNKTLKVIAYRPPVLIHQPVYKKTHYIYVPAPVKEKKKKKKVPKPASAPTQTKKYEEEREKSYERSAMIEGW